MKITSPTRFVYCHATLLMAMGFAFQTAPGSAQQPARSLNEAVALAALTSDITGAVVMEDCIAYSLSSLTSEQIPLKEGTLLVFGRRTFPHNYTSTERKNGLIRVRYIGPNIDDIANDKYIWVPEKSIKVLNWRGINPWDYIGPGLSSNGPKRWSENFVIAAQNLLFEIHLKNATAKETRNEEQPLDPDVFGDWKYNVTINPITDATDIIAILASENNAGGTLIDKPAHLVMRLRDGVFEFYVDFGFIIANNDKPILSRVRFNKGSFTNLYFIGSSDSTGLFFLEAKGYTYILSKHDTFSIEAKPHNQVARAAIFKLDGMANIISKFEKDGNIKMMNQLQTPQ